MIISHNPAMLPIETVCIAVSWWTIATGHFARISTAFSNQAAASIGEQADHVGDGFHEAVGRRGSRVNLQQLHFASERQEIAYAKLDAVHHQGESNTKDSLVYAISHWVFLRDRAFLRIRSLQRRYK